MGTRIGLIGLGEVGTIFARAFIEHGAELTAYDVLLSRPDGRELLARRAGDCGIQLRPLAETVENAEYVLSLVTTGVAREVAESCAGFLRPGQVYLDLTSTSPGAKRRIRDVVQPTGAAFVEGAILGAVGATGVRSRILTCGEQGRQVAELFTSLGLNVSFYSPEIGQASMFKMLRSIFSKGLEALLLELMLAGKRAGIEKDLWQDVVELMTRTPFDRTAANWIQTHALACDRRLHEMSQVVETLDELGVEPLMTTATEAFFARSTTLGFGEAFSEKPAAVDPVVEFMERRLSQRVAERHF
jgi:3-hydroxyisobutyrate dehydrogenase-like beta-hydroxyacid dehydrogenase